MTISTLPKLAVLDSGDPGAVLARAKHLDPARTLSSRANRVIRYHLGSDVAGGSNLLSETLV
jgi:hypothetical protein